METIQRDAILKICNEIEQLPIEENIAEAYASQGDITQIHVTGIPVPLLVSDIKRTCIQFKTELQGEDYYYLPFEYAHPQYGNTTIQAPLAQIQTIISSKQTLNDAINQILWLIHYQIIFGFWDKSKFKIHDVKTIDVKSKETEINLLKEKLKIETAKTDALILELGAGKEAIETEKKNVALFIEQKQAEVKLISDAVPIVTNQKNEIDTLLKTATTSETEIRTIQKNHTELFTQLKLQKETQEKDFKIQTEKTEEENVKLKSIIDNGDVKVKFFESLEKFIKDKQAEIVELGALAAGAALGGTFGLREKKLSEGMTFWKFGVPIITVLAMAWVVVFFTCLASKTGVVWVDIILNLAKTLPAFILMGFVFKQYNKERNIQEEYAFKAAVANTIKAYSDLLKGEDIAVNLSRQEMLKDAIKQVQTAPKLHAEEGGKVFSFSTKYLADSLKNLNDTVKTFNPKP